MGFYPTMIDMFAVAPFWSELRFSTGGFKRRLHQGNTECSNDNQSKKAIKPYLVNDATQFCRFFTFFVFLLLPMRWKIPSLNKMVPFVAKQNNFIEEGSGVGGVQAHPQEFWFGENPGKIHKIWANSLKTWTKMAPNVLWVEEMAPNTVFMRNYSHKKWPKIVSGKFGEIRAKILCTPKNLPAPMPTVESIISSKKTLLPSTVTCYLCFNCSDRTP